MNSIVKKKVVALLAVVMVIFAACGDDDSTATTPGAATTVAAAPTTAAPTTVAALVTVRQAQFLGAGMHLPEVAGLALGIFEDHGIKMELQPLGNTGLHLAGLVSGSLQVAANAPVVVANAMSEGTELQYFCGQVATDWNVLLTGPESDIPTIEDGASWQEVVQSLEGRDVGVSSRGGTQETRMLVLLELAGVDPSSVGFVGVGAVAESMAALEAGLVDTIFGFPFVTQRLLADGNARIALDLTKYGPDPAFLTGYFATSEWLAENADVAQSYCDAVHETIEFLSDPANVDELNEILETEFGLDTAEVRDQAVGEFGVLPLYDTNLDCDSIQRALDLAVVGGIIAEEAPTDCAALIWDEARER